MVSTTEDQKLYQQRQYSSPKCNNRYLSKDKVVANLKSRLEMQKCEAKELVSSSQFGKLHQLLTSAEKKGSFDERHDLLEFITGLLANTIAKNHGASSFYPRIQMPSAPLFRQTVKQIKTPRCTHA